MSENTKKINKIGYEVKNYFSNILVEIVLLCAILFAIINNLCRFSNKKTILQITNKQSVFIYGIISIFSILFLIYCKHLTILNISSVKQNLLPIFFVFIPFITVFIILYYNTDTFIKTNEIGYENIDSDITFAINTSDNSNNKFTLQPSISLSKSGRIILNLFIIGLIIFNFSVFIKFFNKNDGRTILDKVISNNENTRIANKIISLFFIILIIVNMLTLYQQYIYSPCKLGLPFNWNI